MKLTTAPVAKKSDVIWNELSLVLQAGKPKEIARHLHLLSKQQLHPLFRAALDAQILWNEGAIAQACEELENAQKTRKLGPHEILMLGLILYEKEEFDEAEKQLDFAFEKGVLDSRLVLARAGVQIAKEKYTVARKILHTSLKAEMNQWRAWLLLGEVEILRKDLRAAADAFLAVTRLAPNFEPGWTHAAGVLVDLGYPERAAELLRRICSVRPSFVAAQLAFAQVLQNLGQFKEALHCLRTVGRYAMEPTMLMEIAEMMFKLQEYQDCANILNRAQEQAQHLPKLWFLRGELANAAGLEGRANAIQHYREALLRDREFKPARERLDALLAQI
jgi:tetratricopeptide (TPR) repeat protein